MELALILMLGGLSWWLMRPLRDWYVVDISRGTESAGKQVFQEMEAAEQAWARAVQDMRKVGDSGTVFLWHVEARSRRQALSGKLPAGKEPMLQKREEIKA